MKNVTLSADERLIEAARQKARSRKTTLNAEFRRWLERYAQDDGHGADSVRAYRRLMKRMSEISTRGKRFTRDELNER